MTLPTEITFAEYMEQALYGPDGYYSSGKAASGKEGDYFTAPDVSPVFGRLLTHIFMSWRERWAHRDFDLVEIGAGEGKLAQVMAESLANDFPSETKHVVFTAIEKSEARRKVLGQLAREIPCPFKVLPGLDSLAPSSVSGCIFANELIDAFPVHRVRMMNGQLEELYVGAHRSAPSESREREGQNALRCAPTSHWKSPSTPALAAYLDRLKITLPDGYETEINLEMGGWMHRVAEVLAEGVIVLVDYGRPALEYYAPERDRGTLRGFQNHRLVNELLQAEPSSMDWTADVDFTSLAWDAQSAGLEVLAYMDMSSFLMLGAENYLRQSSIGPAHTQGLRYLIHPEGLGSKFQVLILGKGVDRQEWRFHGNRILRLGLGGSYVERR